MQFVADSISLILCVGVGIVIPFCVIYILLLLRRIEASQRRQEKQRVIQLIDKMAAGNDYPKADVEFVISFALGQFWSSVIFVDSPIHQLVAEIRTSHANEANEQISAHFADLRDRLIDTY
ncbi:MAG: hypothetical protein NXI22_26035 [bacterium]|nr:hypothetical protein [bacterium]